MLLDIAQVCWNPADTAAQPAVTAAGTVTAVGVSLSAVSPEVPSCPDPPEPARCQTSTLMFGGPRASTCVQDSPPPRPTYQSSIELWFLWQWRRCGLHLRLASASHWPRQPERQLLLGRPCRWCHPKCRAGHTSHCLQRKMCMQSTAMVGIQGPKAAFQEQ